MTEITRVGADLAKAVIQVHGVDAMGSVVTNRPLPRDKFMTWCAQLPAGCIVAMEASSSVHHWARKLVALGLDARIFAAHLVAPYRLQGKGGKNDANDAAAICEAASWPQMHFVPIKTIEQQSMLCIHRLREPSPTNPLWHPIGGDHGNGMGRCRAVRIWGRFQPLEINKPVCRCAVCSEFDRSFKSPKCRNTVYQERSPIPAVD